MTNYAAPVASDSGEAPGAFPEHDGAVDETRLRVTVRRVVPLVPASPSMSAVVISGDLVFVSGQVALDDHNQLVGENDFRHQAVQCFENLGDVLTRAGTRLDQVVQVTAFICHREDLADYLDVRALTFPGDPPATTTVVADLLDPRFLIEIQAIAHVPGPR